MSKLTTRQIGPVWVAQLQSHHLDARNAEMVGRLLAATVAERMAVVIDVSSVCYVDCLGFECLLDAVRHCPGKVRFGGVSTGLDSLFVLSHLRSAIDVFDTVEAAVASFN